MKRKKIKKEFYLVYFKKNAIIRTNFTKIR